MEEIKELCNDESFYDAVHILNIAARYKFSGRCHLHWFLQVRRYAKPKSPKQFIFFGVNERDVIQAINDLRQNPNSFNNEIGLVGLCRSLIAYYGKWAKLLQFIHYDNIPPYVNHHTRACSYIELEAIRFKDEDKVRQKEREISIFDSFQSMDWNKLIRLCKKRYPEGIFNPLNFEESIFLIYLPPDVPHFYEKKSSHYHSDLKFYSECVAAAIQQFMKTLGYNDDFTLNQEQNHISLSSQICLRFLDFFDEQQKLSKENEGFFNEMKFEGESTPILKY